MRALAPSSRIFVSTDQTLLTLVLFRYAVVTYRTTTGGGFGGHFFLMVLHFTVVVVFTVAIAYLSRWYFEEPFLQFK
jgi:peptidoglycan/LPS O-acetylase OafA/YrhL